MFVKLSHAIVITLLLYFMTGKNQADSIQAADTPPNQETVAELQFKAFSNSFIRTINLER